MHNIKEGHDIKVSVADTFVNYAKALNKTKTAQGKKNKKNHKFKMQAKTNYQIP